MTTDMNEVVQNPRPLLFGYGGKRKVRYAEARKPGTSRRVYKGRSWSEEERDVLRNFYVTGGLRECTPRLPERTRSSILQEAHRMGFGTHRRWTTAEDQVLTLEWGRTQVSELAKRLGRSEKAIRKHIWQCLDLGKGIPQGCECLTAAAERSGYAVQTLRKVLAHSGIRLTRLVTKHVHRMWYVASKDVDRSVSKWLATEEVATAALRYELAPSTLRCWLREAGIQVPPRYRAHWRVESDVIDRVVVERRAFYSSTESIVEAALRHKIPDTTLARWLHNAGKGQKGRHWRLDPKIVDSVVSQRSRRRNIIEGSKS